MRTTLTIDDDLAGILKERAHSLGKSFKDVVNSALREGLSDKLMHSAPIPSIKTRPHDFETRPGIDWNRLNQLSDDLETDDFADKHHSRRPLA